MEAFELVIARSDVDRIEALDHRCTQNTRLRQSKRLTDLSSALQGQILGVLDREHRQKHKVPIERHGFTLVLEKGYEWGKIGKSTVFNTFNGLFYKFLRIHAGFRPFWSYKIAHFSVFSRG